MSEKDLPETRDFFYLFLENELLYLVLGKIKTCSISCEVQAAFYALVAADAVLLCMKGSSLEALIGNIGWCLTRHLREFSVVVDCTVYRACL